MRVLDGVDSGSNYQFGDKLAKPAFPRSAFDLSHLNTMTVPNAGMVFPVLCKEVLPSDSWQVRINALLRVLPQVVPLYSRQRMYFDAFYVRCSDVWKDWNVYMKKGNDGNTLLTRPALTMKNISSDGLSLTGIGGADPDPDDSRTWSKAVVQANSIYDYMGIPIGTDLVDLIGKGYHIDALPFAALLQIYRWYYLNKNTYIQDKAMFPDDESDFRLNDDGRFISFLNSEVSTNVLGSSMWRLWAQDYFTSALPFAQRGSAPTLDLHLNGLASGTVFADSLTGGRSNDVLMWHMKTADLSQSQYQILKKLYGDEANARFVKPSESDPSVPADTYPTSLSSANGVVLQNAKIAMPTLPAGIVLDDIRRLAISQLELERMARTDGTYEEFGLTFFGQSSRNAVDFKPLYVGSCYQEVAFSEVLQTSSSDAVSPLGSYAGHGISVTQDGNIGSFTADDYGYFIVLCSIMPDVYYFQGLDRMYTKSIQSEEFLPNRDKMGMRPILNQEIFLSGTKSVDEDLFAYQNPFDEFRYCANEIHGQIADSSKASFFPYTQARKFDSTPNWNANFVTADNVRKDFLSAPVEDAYTMQVRFDIRAVRPLSYVASPAEVIN